MNADEWIASAERMLNSLNEELEKNQKEYHRLLAEIHEAGRELFHAQHDKRRPVKP